MKKTYSVISLLLTLLLLIGAVTAAPVSAAETGVPKSFTDLAESGTVTLDLPADTSGGPASSTYYRYIPSADGFLNVSFRTEEENNYLSCGLYDSGMNELVSRESASVSYERLHYPVEAGKTYYLTLMRTTLEADTVEIITELSAHFRLSEGQSFTVNTGADNIWLSLAPTRDFTMALTTSCWTNINLYDDSFYYLGNGSASADAPFAYDVKQGRTYYFHVDCNVKNTDFTVSCTEKAVESIAPGETKSVTLSSSAAQEYVFIPDRDMVVDFSGKSSENIYGKLLDERREVLVSGYSNDFHTLCSVYGGTKYYVSAQLNSWYTITADAELNISEFVPENELTFGKSATAKIDKRYDAATFKFTVPHDMLLEIDADADDVHVGADRTGSVEFSSGSRWQGDGKQYIGLAQKGEVFYIISTFNEHRDGEISLTAREVGEEIKLGETKQFKGEYLKFVADKDMRVLCTSQGIDDETEAQLDVIQARKFMGEMRYPYGGIYTQGNFCYPFFVEKGETYFLSISRAEDDVSVSLTLSELPENNIELNKVYEVNEYGFFKYTPKKDMSVSFESVKSAYNVFGTAYDGSDEFKRIKTNLGTEDRSVYQPKGDGKDFVLTCDLEAGTTYYFMAEASWGERGKFNVVLKGSDETPKGDADGDGAVDARDRVFLTRYLAKWKGYDKIDENAADVNADGKVNTKDRIILARHIAKWKGYETLPHKG